jgi:hypothetical protein
MLIGSYCTMEYAIESSPFNPSIVEDFDHLEIGENESLSFFRTVKVILFHRAILIRIN